MNLFSCQTPNFSHINPSISLSRLNGVSNFLAKLDCFFTVSLLIPKISIPNSLKTP